MQYIFDLLLAAVFFFLSTLPGILVAFLGWRLADRIKDPTTVIIVRGGLISVAIAPTLYGHAGFVPAISAVFFPPERGKVDVTANIHAIACMDDRSLDTLRRAKPGTQI